MKRIILLGVLALMAVATLWAQPRYDRSKLKTERLNRGVVAVRNGGKVIISWRALSSDAVGEAFQVYRDGVKLTRKPLKKGGTFFIDEQPSSSAATYEVRGGKVNGTYTLAARAPDGYLPIPIQKPADGVSPDGFRYSFIASDASIGDVDGDGQYEISPSGTPPTARTICSRVSPATPTSTATVLTEPASGASTSDRTFVVVLISNSSWSSTSMATDVLNS